MIWQDHIPRDIQDLYEVYDARHAAAILKCEFPKEFGEICEALRRFRFTVDEVKAPGGSESEITKKFAKLLRPLKWEEATLKAEMVVDKKPVSMDTHWIDFVKSKVAFDFEWNSKDQTFDRDLGAFRAFFEFGKISVGVLVTRGPDLDPWFATLGTLKGKDGKVRQVRDKYGASTTRWDQLIPRLEAGRSGGCPVLAFGISTKLIAKKG